MESSLVINFSDEKEQYFSSAVEKILQNNNTGYLPAFYNSLINEEGIRFTQESFKKVMDGNDVLCNWKVLPQDFVLKIRFSPISFFKKWVLLITNRHLLKISEYNTPKLFEREFFFLFMDTQIYLFQITNNLSHERFLYRLYFREPFKEKNIIFSTFFNEQKKLIVYKDYYRRKFYTVPFPGKNFIKNKLYQIRVSVLKEIDNIRYLIYVNGLKLTHQIKIANNSQVSEEKVPEPSIVETPKAAKPSSKGRKKKPDSPSGGQLSLAEYRREVVEILAKTHQKECETNKFANVSLGRVHSVPILVNLSQKYKNIKIKIFFKSKEEVLQIYTGTTLIKTFSVSFSPKSNWLERA